MPRRYNMQSQFFPASSENFEFLVLHVYILQMQISFTDRNFVDKFLQVVIYLALVANI